MRTIDDVFVGIATSEEARQSRALKHLFSVSEGAEWFTEIHADGNEHHIDHWPDEILVVVVKGRINLALAANDRHWP